MVTFPLRVPLLAAPVDLPRLQAFQPPRLAGRHVALVVLQRRADVLQVAFLQLAERPTELDTDDEPRLRAPPRVQHHPQDAVDAEPGMAEADIIRVRSLLGDRGFVDLPGDRLNAIIPTRRPSVREARAVCEDFLLGNAAPHRQD